MRVWVLLFNADSDNPGIYTMQVDNHNIVVAFEEEEEALRYAGLLEAQDFLNPNVEAIDEEELEAFCQDAGYDLTLVPQGALAIPPERNNEIPDWQADSKAEDDVTDVGETFHGEKIVSTDPAIEAMRRRLEGLL
jgi:hypothetical protein